MPNTLSPPLGGSADNLKQLQRRLRLRIILGLLLTSVLIGVLAAVSLYQSHAEQLQTKLQFEIELQVVALESEVSRLKNLASQVTSRTGIRKKLEAYLNGKVAYQGLLEFTAPKLRDAMHQAPGMEGITRTDARGKVLIEVGLPIPQIHWPRGFDGETVQLGTPFEWDGRQWLVASAPINNRKGHKVGIDLVLFSTDKLRRIFDGFVERRGTDQVVRLSAVVPKTVSYFLRTPGDLPKPVEAEADEEAREAMSGVKKSLHQMELAGEHYLIQHEQIPGTNWAFLYVNTGSKLFAPAREQAIKAILAVLILAVVGILLTIALVRPLVGRITVQNGELAELLQDNQDLLEEAETHRERLQAILDNTTSVVYLKDMQGRYLLINRAYESILGVTREQVIGQTDRDLFPADFAEAFVANDQLVIRQGRSLQLDEQTPGPGGTHDYLSIKFPMRGMNGEITGVCGISTDITERKASEKALRQSEQRFELAMRAANDGLWDWNLINNEVYLSPRWKSMLGYSDDELQNSFATWEELVHPDDRQQTLTLIEKTLANHGQGFNSEFRMRHKDGHWVQVLSRATLVSDSSGKPIRFVGTHVDITEEARLQRELRESESRANLIIDTAPDAIIMTDAEGRMVRVNPRVMQLFGYAEAELLGKHVEMLLPEEVREAHIASRQGYIETPRFLAMRDRNGSSKLYGLRKDGNRFPLEAGLSPVHIGDDVNVVVALKDISERVQAEEALEAYQSNLEQLVAERTTELEAITAYNRMLFETSPVGLVLCELDGTLVDVNPAYLNIVGYSEAEAKALSYWDITPSDYEEQEAAQLASLSECGRYGPYEKEYVHKSGKRVPVRLNGLHIERDGKTYIWSAVEDISERREIENALRDSEHNLAHAQAIAHLGSWYIDVESNVLQWSDETYRIFGLEKGAVTDLEGFVSCIHPEDTSRVLAQWQAALAGAPYDVEHRVVSSGREKWVRERAEFAYGTDGQVVSALGTVQDISELKAAEFASQQALQEAQRLARARSEFVANMSHEIRTPLNGVLGLARMGERSAGDDAHKLFERIGESGQHLLRVVNDVLDFSKIEAGKLQVEHRPFKLHASLHSVIDLVRGQAEEKQLVCDLMIAPGLPDWVAGDAMRLEQVLLNLVSNAVKFTEQGRVTLSADHDETLLKFSVVDSGIGMGEGQLEQLFRPFEQADSSTTRRFGGTGLGLAISINLVRLMGGDIDVSSELGKGSVFTVSLPLQLASPLESVDAAPSPSAGGRLKGLQVMAAEDVEVNRLVLADLLDREGAHVLFAHDGQQAIELLEEQGVGSFDIALMDIQMPVMDGYTAAAEIHRLAPGLPVIGLTAHALEEERQRCLDAGMLDHVAKPIDVEKLVATMLKHSGREASIGQPVSGSPIGESQPSDTLIDRAALLRRFQGRDAFVGKLAETIYRSHKDTPDKLRGILASEDFAELRFVAHSLKSVAGNLEAAQLHEMATQIELLAKSLDQQAFQLVPEFVKMMDKLLAELADMDI